MKDRAVGVNVGVRAAQPEDDAAVVEIGNRLAPEFPRQTVDELRYSRNNRPKETLYDRYVAEVDGAVVGWAALAQMWWVVQPSTFNLRLQVDPEHWNRGIGGRLYDLIEGRAYQVGARTLYGYLREDRPSADRFASRRGFSRTGRADRESRLDVHRANLEGYEGIEERLRKDGIQIVTLAELGAGDEEVLHSVHVMCDLAIRDIPSSEEFTSTPCDLWHAEVRGSPGMSPEHSWIALDGTRPVGVAFLKRKGTNAAYNDFTGTDRAYRGRGIARALKWRTIEWARRNGIDFIYTGNDVENKRMLAINIRLGYEVMPGFLEVAKRL